MLERGIDGAQIFFTDETQIKTGSFIKDSIRLSEDNQIKLKEGKKEAFKLINREEKKFEASIMIAGGICSYGLSRLILAENTVNEFAYAQALLYFKDDMDEIKKKCNCEIYFEQDGATSHTSKSNKLLINQLFGEENYIQNPPNSPDLAYPIENLWGYIKPRIKKRNPQDLDDLKKITIDEWYKIPKELIKKCGRSYTKRLEKIIELRGERLEPFHLKEIEEELNDEKKEENIDKKDKKDEEDKTKEIPRKIGRLNEGELVENTKESKKMTMRIIYNDKRLGILRKKEIAQIRKTIKEVRQNYAQKNQELKKYKAKDFKMMGVARAQSIYKQKQNLKPNKEKKIEELEKNIKDLEKMDITEYLKYSKSRDAEDKILKDKDDQESTIDDEIEKKIENIKYELEF